MAELNFHSDISWSGGRLGRARVNAGGEIVQVSAPASMGGLGAGTNPEELLLSAVGSCYTATLAAILEAARLPASRIGVKVEGTVSDHPGASARFSAIVVNPNFSGIDAARATEYEGAAERARERCFIGGQLASHVNYRVGAVDFEPTELPTGGTGENAEILDVRSLAPARRHELIFETLGEMASGGALTLVNDHDPKPLYYQLEATQPGQFSWEYVQEGPREWRVRIARKSA